jgi:hypothetical protein
MKHTSRRLRGTNTPAKDENARSSGEMGLGEGLVIGLLNMERNAEAQRVAELVEACRRVNQLMESIKASSGPNSKQSVEVKNALNEINTRLSAYQWHPGVFGFMGAESHFKVRYIIVGKSNDAALACEHYAIQWIVDHVDVVHRIRRCQFPQCRKWFFAKTDHQKYCGDNCRQRDASRGESFKEKRRVYMKKYRREEAARDARAKRLAKGKSK